jgi:hypothetical protein
MATKNQQKERMKQLESTIESIEAGTQGGRKPRPAKAQPSDGPLGNDEIERIFRKYNGKK